MYRWEEKIRICKIIFYKKDRRLETLQKKLREKLT